MFEKQILLIDDNEIDIFIHKKVLENQGVVNNILTFTTITAVLAFLKQSNNTPHLIFLDIHFPLMDGFEFLDKLDELKIERKYIEVFILSASVDPLLRQKAKERNCAGFIEKPLTIDKLYQQQIFMR
jgi:CheY-like chemotaxis protein